MKLLLNTILSLLLVIPCHGRSFTIAEHDFADTIRITYRNGLVMVPVTIKGRTYQFFYDTGASISMIPVDLDDLLDKELGGERVLAFNDKDSEKLRNGIISEMTIGRLHISGMKGVLTRHAPNGCLLGANALYKNGIMAKLDIRKGLLILTDRKDYFATERGFNMSLRKGTMLPTVRFTLSYGCKGNALFDTGFNSFMNVSRKYYDKSLKGDDGERFQQQVAWSDYGSSIIGINGVEQPEEKVRMKLDEVRIETRESKQEGYLSFCNIPVETSRNYTAIGSRILEFGSMIINPFTSILTYQPYEDSSSLDSDSNTPGDYRCVDIKGKVSDITFNPSDSRVKVEMINPNSEYYKRGVRKGDYLIAINGRHINSYADYVMVMSMQRKGLPYTQTFQNANGEMISVVLK